MAPIAASRCASRPRSHAVLIGVVIVSPSTSVRSSGWNERSPLVQMPLRSRPCPVFRKIDGAGSSRWAFGGSTPVHTQTSGPVGDHAVLRRDAQEGPHPERPRVRHLGRDVDPLDDAANEPERVEHPQPVPSEPGIERLLEGERCVDR